MSDELDRIGATRIQTGKNRGRLVSDLSWIEIHALWASWNGLPDDDWQNRKAFSKSLRKYIDSGRVPRNQKPARVQPVLLSVTGRAAGQPGWPDE